MLTSHHTIRSLLVMLTLGVVTSPALAVNIAIIDTDNIVPSLAESFCNFVEQNGDTCTAFPTSGPTSSLDPFDVVLDLSGVWSDPEGLLADHLRKGKGVITWGGAPSALGIETDPTVRSWIGANTFAVDGDFLITTDTDPILGNSPIGTVLGFCGDSPCSGLTDTTGHPEAKILVNFADTDLVPNDVIGMLRNTWEGGQSIYFSNGIEVSEPLLRSIDILGNPIPTVSTWGLVVMTLTMLIAGSVVIRKRMTV